MVPKGRSPTVARGALGLFAVASSYALDRTITYGYGFSGYAYLFHGGLFVLILAVTSGITARTALDDVHRYVISAVVASVGLNLISVGLHWYEIAGPSWSGRSPALLDLAIERLEFGLPMTPLAAGYVLGAASGNSSDRRWMTDVSGLLFAFGGPILGYALVASQGYPPLFIAGFYPITMIGGLVAAIPVYFLVRATTGDDSVSSGPME